MKTVAKLAFIATALIGGSAFAFDGSMVDYPSNVAVEQHEPALTRAAVKADLLNNEARVQVNDNTLQYPSVYTDATTDAPMLSRAEVKHELKDAVGNHFRAGFSTIETGRS